MYIKNLIREIRTWLEVRKTVKENVSKINELGFDVDWVGRIYTVMNIPDELNDLPHRNVRETIERNAAIDLYIKNQLGEISRLLGDLRLSDLIMYPEGYEQFEDSNSILLVLAPDREYFTLPKVFAFLVGVFCVVMGITVFVSWILTR